MTTGITLAKLIAGVGRSIVDWEKNDMASFMIKVAGEGLVSAAHRLAESGPTSGYAVVYEVTNCPDNVTVDQVVSAFKAFKAPKDRYEIDFSELTV